MGKYTPRHRKRKGRHAGLVYTDDHELVKTAPDDIDDDDFTRMLPPVDVYTYPAPPFPYRPASDFREQDRLALIQMLQNKITELDVIEDREQHYKRLKVSSPEGMKT